MSPEQTRILIVDDEEPIRTSLANFLDDFGYQVQTAPSAEEAQKLLQNESFHLGIIDLRLPGVSGEVFILQAHQLHPEMRFLIHTGSINYSLPEELKQIGLTTDDVLHKPQTDLNNVLEHIRQLLAAPAD